MEYLKLLINQFNQSKGYEKYDLNSNIYLDEFCEWIIELRKNLNYYFNFINNFGIDNDSLIVLNKGKYDFIANQYLLISPFADTLGKLNSRLVMYQGEPFIITGSNISKGQVVDTYTTYNPYNKSYINGLDYIHANGIKICLGIFGSSLDRDINQKYMMMKKFETNLEDNYRVEYINIQNNYYYIIFSSNKVKSKILIK